MLGPLSRLIARLPANESEESHTVGYCTLLERHNRYASRQGLGVTVPYATPPEHDQKARLLEGDGQQQRCVRPTGAKTREHMALTIFSIIKNRYI